MKIIELDLRENGKKYFCKQANEVFKVEEGNLIPVKRNFSMAELLKMDFEEIDEMKNPYKQARYGDKYYSIFEFRIRRNMDSNHEIDNKLFSTANYFNNKEYAKYIAFKETLMRRIDRFAWEHNAKVIDWHDHSTKYYITFANGNNELIVDWDFAYKSNNIYFTSKEIAEKAIEEFKDDLMKLYTWEFDF